MKILLPCLLLFIVSNKKLDVIKFGFFAGDLVVFFFFLCVCKLLGSFIYPCWSKISQWCFECESFFTGWACVEDTSPSSALCKFLDDFFPHLDPYSISVLSQIPVCVMLNLVDCNPISFFLFLSCFLCYNLSATDGLFSSVFIVILT